MENPQIALARNGAMRTALVLTVIGDDRPGIVEQVSGRVAAAGANCEESSMARLAGKCCRPPARERAVRAR